MATDFDRGEGVETRADAHADADPRPVEVGAAAPRPKRRRAPKTFTVTYEAVGAQEVSEAARARVVELLRGLLGRG